MQLWNAYTVHWNGNGKQVEDDGDHVFCFFYLPLSPGGGVGIGEVASSPGCSEIRVSAGEPGGCALGGVEEDLRPSVQELLPFTHDVSITLTPTLPTERPQLSQSLTHKPSTQPLNTTQHLNLLHWSVNPLNHYINLFVVTHKPPWVTIFESKSSSKV